MADPSWFFGCGVDSIPRRFPIELYNTTKGPFYFGITGDPRFRVLLYFSDSRVSMMAKASCVLRVSRDFVRRVGALADPSGDPPDPKP